MRKLFQNIAVFAVPFGGLLFWLLWATPAKEYSYNMIQKDCRTGGWMYRRLYENPKPVDVAFVGTSKTMCDINDSLVEYRLRTEHGRQWNLANFGVCRLGENLHWLIARDLFAQKHPKYLIVEVSTELAGNSHFHFPYLARSSDVLGAPLWANSDYLEDVVALCWNRLVYQREHLLGIRREFGDQVRTVDHSFMRVAKDGVAEAQEMERIKQKRQKNLTQALPTGVARWIYDANARPPKYYFRQMAALCKEHGAQVIFLYLPVYGTPAKAPQEVAFFESMGPVWIPPDSVFGNPNLHFDHSHLNMAGAAKLSDWLVGQLAALP